MEMAALQRSAMSIGDLMTALHVGYGRLLIDNDDVGETIYSFRSYDDGSHSAGVLSGNVPGISRALARSDCRLRLEGGVIIRIQVYEANFSRGLFKIPSQGAAAP